MVQPEPRRRQDVRIDFTPAWQEERGDDHLPTGQRLDPEPGPWDDCFGMPGGVDVTLTWPGQLELKVASREEWVVVYDEQEAAVCVEPQTGPPNGLNTLPRLVTPIEPLEATTTGPGDGSEPGHLDLVTGGSKLARMTDVRGALLQQIKDKAVVHGKVTLSSGLEADYYVDLRRVTLDGEAAPLVGQVLLDLTAGPRLRRRRRAHHGRRPGRRRDAARRRRARAAAGRLRRPQGGQGARPAAPGRGARTSRAAACSSSRTPPPPAAPR